MPWKSSGKLPPSAQKLKGHSRAIWVATANNAMKEYKDDEGRAIATANAAVNKYQAKRSKAVKKSLHEGDMKGKGIKKALLDGTQSLLDKAFGDTHPDAPAQVEITKNLDVEQRRALFVVLEPDAIDEHGDTYSAEEVEKACTSFNTHCNQANLFHRIQIEDAKIEQSFIAPASFTLDNGVEIKKGTWLQWWHFPEDNPNSEVLWEMVKNGEVQGVSVGCTAIVEELE